jgi:hypothetical protein
MLRSCVGALGALVFLLVSTERAAFRQEQSVTPPQKSAQASAGGSSEEPTSPEPVAMETRWYGWQTLIADGGALGLGIASRQPAVFLIGYLAAPPIIHWSHGKVGAGFASLGLRVGAPLVGGLTGYMIDVSTSKPCGSDEWLCLRGLGGLLIGTFVGYVGAVAVDAAVLTRERVPREVPPSSGVQWQPTFAVTARGATGGVGGVF